MFTKLFHDKVVYSRRMERLTELISEMMRGWTWEMREKNYG